MKHFWMGVAMACISGAGVSLWWQHYDAAFVIGTMGALAWFLNYRAGLKATIVGEPNDDESRESNED